MILWTVRPVCTRWRTGKLCQEYRRQRKLGLAADYREAAELPFAAGKALFFQGQAHFHPLKFLKAVAEPLVIYEQTRVLHVEKNQVYTTGGRVTAEHIVFCSHYPFQNFPGYYFLRMHQERSCDVLALEHAGKVNAMYYGVDGPRLSLRMQGEVLLLGGEGHRTGKNEGGRYQRLRDAARSYWPQSREVLAWSAQDCMPMDKVPYIGRFSRATPNWYVATGFQKWGMSKLHGSGDDSFGFDREGGKSMGRCVFTTAVLFCGFGGRAVSEYRAGGEGTGSGSCGGKGWLSPWEGSAGTADGTGGGEGATLSAFGLSACLESGRKTWDCPCHGSRFKHGGQDPGGAGTEQSWRNRRITREKIDRFWRI